MNKSFWTNQRVLVTGAAGFIGANLVQQLVKKKAKVNIIQKPSSDLWRLKDIKKNLTFYKTQLSNRKKLIILLKKINPQVIYHLAAHGNSPNQVNIDEIVTTNIIETLNLLLASKEVDYKAFINTGSSSEYGFKSKAMSEKDLCSPISFYAASKLSATVLSQVFARIYNKPVMTFRLFSVYGPYENKNRLIPTIINSFVNNHPIKLTQEKCRHDFIYVKDVVDAYLKAPELINYLKEEVLNLGAGKEYTNDEVLEAFFRAVKGKALTSKQKYPSRIWDTPHWKANMTKTRKLLGWQAKFSLEQGLKKTYAWFLDNKSLYDEPKR